MSKHDISEITKKVNELGKYRSGQNSLAGLQAASYLTTSWNIAYKKK